MSFESFLQIGAHHRPKTAPLRLLSGGSFLMAPSAVDLGCDRPLR